MKKLAFLTLLIISTYSYANCNYENINSSSYRVSELSNKYISLDFLLSEKSTSFSHSLDNKKYEWIANSEFKVLKTGVPTKYTQERNGSSLSRYQEIDLAGKLYKRDTVGTTEMITADCKKFYYKGDRPTDHLVKSDGSKLSDADVLHIFGSSLTPITITASSKYDEFDKMHSISTTMFKGEYLLRGHYNETSKKLEIAQIYLISSSVLGWQHFQTAKDLNGNSYTITKIDADADCKGASMGLPCITKETVGININEELLVNNQEGFKLKLYGKMEKVIEISPEVIKPFLAELDKVKTN